MIDLYDRWLQFDRRHTAEVEFRSLMKAYSTPPRAYHNLVHIGQCLEELDAVIDQALDRVALEAAVWFHDAVYDPRSHRNESDSAWLAHDFLNREGAPIATREKTIMLIMSTKTHSENVDKDVQLLSDIDLSILGQPEEAFWDYERKIRIEYDFVPEAGYRIGRTRILKKFFDRPSVYFTDYFKAKYELQAKRNLDKSIENLLG